MELVKDSTAEEQVKEWYENYQRKVLDKLTPKLIEYYKKYRSYLDDNPQRESNVFIPRCFDSVETSVPRLLLAMYSNRPAWQFQPVSRNDIKASEIFTELYEYYSRVGNFFMTDFLATKSSEIFNTSIMKSAWDFEKNRPLHFLVQRNEFFIDPTAMSIEEADYCGDRKVRSEAYLKKMGKLGRYKNIEKVLATGVVYNGSSSGNADLDRSMKSVLGLDEAHTVNSKEKYYEVIECYHNDAKQITTTAGGILIRNEANPFPHGKAPYAPIITVPDVADFDGIGLIEPIRFLQDEVNDFNNAMMDYVNRTLSPITKVATSEFERYKSWKLKSGEVWVMNDIKNGMEFDRIPPLPPEAFGIQAYLTQNIDRTLALSDYVRGTQPAGGSSATEATILSQAADNRLKLKLYALQYCFKKIVELDLKNIQSFVKEEFVVRLTEKPGQFNTYRREDIQGELDVYPTGSAEIISKEVKRAQYINLMGTIFNPEVRQMLLVEGTALHLTPLVKQILETFSAREIDEILKPVKAAVSSAPLPSTSSGGGQVIPENLSQVLKSTAEEVAPLQMQ